MSQTPFNPFQFLTTPWGNLPIGSGMSGPAGFNAADIQELDKRINELKAVEQWLSLNLNLLKTTIQGLEVQRGTVAAIHSFTESMTTPGTAPKAGTSPQAGAPSAITSGLDGQAADQATLWWESMQQQFGQMMQAAQAGAQSMVDQTTKPPKKSTNKPGKNSPTAGKD